MIELENVTKYYGEFMALDSITFDVNKGEILGLLGPNGAGKTTTMRILTGYLSYNDGKVLVGGINPDEDPLKTKKMIGYLPENPILYDELTVLEFLTFISKLKQVENITSEISKVMEKVDLTDRQHQVIGALSRGYKQRVGLAATLISDPEILILDEPTAGLDPNQVLEIRKLIKEMRKEKTIILSTHILPEVEELCERVVLIDKGIIKAVDTVEGLKSMSKGNQICNIKVDDKGKAKEILKSLKEVETFEDKTGDEMEIFLKSLEHRKEILKKLTKAGLYEFYTPGVSLEEVFYHLTLKEGGMQ